MLLLTMLLSEDAHLCLRGHDLVLYTCIRLELPRNTGETDWVETFASLGFWGDILKETGSRLRS